MSCYSIVNWLNILIMHYNISSGINAWEFSTYICLINHKRKNSKLILFIKLKPFVFCFIKNVPMKTPGIHYLHNSSTKIINHYQMYPHLTGGTLHIMSGQKRFMSFCQNTKWSSRYFRWFSSALFQWLYILWYFHFKKIFPLLPNPSWWVRIRLNRSPFSMVLSL